MTSYFDNTPIGVGATCGHLLGEDGSQCGRRVTGWTIGRIDGEAILATACPDHADESTTAFAHVMALPTGDRLDRLVDDALDKEAQA